MAHELAVWLFADRVGTLARVDGRLNFCYAFDWLSHKDAVALSASLPLQAIAGFGIELTPVHPRSNLSLQAGVDATPRRNHNGCHGGRKHANEPDPEEHP